MTDHWRIGGRIDIQQADDYAPAMPHCFCATPSSRGGGISICRRCP
ncbi:hypothetical protein ACF2JD_16485 [Aeromonas sp. A-5]